MLKYIVKGLKIQVGSQRQFKVLALNLKTRINHEMKINTLCQQFNKRR